MTYLLLADGHAAALEGLLAGEALVEHLLLFVEDEAQRLLTVAHDDAHLPSGRPSTCLAMMLSWISLDPPSIVLARERSHSRV